MDYLPDPGQLKLGNGRRKKKQLKGDMDAARGYGQDKYGKGDFDRHRSANVCSICHEPGHKASRHKKQSQITNAQVYLVVCLDHIGFNL